MIIGQLALVVSALFTGAAIYIFQPVRRIFQLIFFFFRSGKCIPSSFKPSGSRKKTA